MLPRHPGITLAEALEDKRQEFLRDADPRIADDDLDVRVGVLEADLDPATALRELHRVRHQVPENLLQAFGITGHRDLAGIQNALDPDASRIGRRPDGFNTLADHRRQLDGADVESNLAGN